MKLSHSDVFLRPTASALVLFASMSLGMGFAAAQDAVPAAEPAGPADAAQPTDESKPDQPDAAKEAPGYAIFRAAAEKIRGAKEITFDAKCFGTGDLESMSQSSTSKVRMLRDETGKWLIRITGSGKNRGKDVENFDAAWRQETIEFVDHAEKKIVERRIREARGPAFQMANASRVDEIASATPFSKALSSTSIEMRDMESADGVDCEVLIAMSGDKKSKIKWLLGAEDHMPRRIERILDGSKFSGSMVVELTNVKLSTTSTLTPQDLRLPKPAEYTEDRQLPVSAQTPSAPTDQSDAEKLKMQQAQDASDPTAGKGRDVPAYKLDKPQSGESKEFDQSEPGQVKPVDPIMEREQAAKSAPTPAPASDPSAAPATPAPAPKAEPFVPTTIPAFELTSSAGGKVSDASLRGSVAVIDFFGSWNIPSKNWQPLLNAGIKADKEIKVFAAAVRERSADAGSKALNDRGIEWPMLSGADQLAKDLGIKVFPATVVVGKDGKVTIFQNCRGEESVEKVKQAITDAKK
jgi:peroxiredoxin